jgi:hypothetical protein
MSQCLLKTIDGAVCRFSLLFGSFPTSICVSLFFFPLPPPSLTASRAVLVTWGLARLARAHHRSGFPQTPMNRRLESASGAFCRSIALVALVSCRFLRPLLEIG